METGKPERTLVRAGFVLFLLALFTGVAIPAFLNQKMALAAHLTGVLNALVLIALGLAWGLVALGPVQARLTMGVFLYGTYVNWGTTCLAAAWGTSRLTPLSGAGYSAAPWKELVVQVLLLSLVLAMITGALLVVYGFRPSASRARAGLPRTIA
ncbi:MAG TPA: hydrogenase [Methylomirabilota bacterium]|jgi:hydroxylaminobenzene mutase|nr:hydrogenase [Methylomirabilota bacterium]